MKILNINRGVGLLPISIKAILMLTGFFGGWLFNSNLAVAIVR